MFWSKSNPSLSSMLPYSYALDKTTFLLHEPTYLRSVPRNFALGRMWRIGNQLNIDAISEGELKALADALASPIKELPKNAIFETRLTFCPINEWQSWEHERRNLDPSITKGFKAHIKNGMPHHMGEQSGRLMLADCCIGLRAPVSLFLPNKQFKALATILSGRYGKSIDSLSKLIEKHCQRQYAEFYDLANVIEKQYKDYGFKPEALDASSFVELIARELCPDGETPLYDPSATISQNAGVHNAAISKNAFESGDYEAHVYSLRKVIGDTWPGMLSAAWIPETISRGANLWTLAQESHITIVVQISMPDQEKLKASLSGKQKNSSRYEHGAAGERRSDVVAQGEDFDVLATKLYRGSGKGVKMSVHIIAWHHKQYGRPQDKLIRFATRRLDMEFFREDEITHTTFPQILPLARNMEFTPESIMRRQRTLALSDAMDYLPVFGSFTGFGKYTPSVPLLNARGERVQIDFLLDNYRPHIVVVGSNRSGKSAFLNWVAHNQLQLGDSFIFIDRHGSYEDLARLSTGRHYRFDIEKPMCLGPFDGPLDEMHQEFMVNSMTEMCTSSNMGRTTTLDHDHIVVLGRILKLWIQEGSLKSIPTLGDFCDYMACHPIRKYKDLCDMILTRLSQYYGDGRYAKFVDGPRDVKIERGCTSFDLAPITNFGQLSSVATVAIFDVTDRFIRAPENADHKKTVVADEVHRYLRSARMPDYLDLYLREYARFKASLCLITQQPTDFEGPVGRTARNNCGAFVTFALNPDEAKAFVDIFQLPSHCVEIIKSLRRHDDCSEGFIFLPGMPEGGGRIIVSGDPDFFIKIGQASHHKEARKG